MTRAPAVVRWRRLRRAVRLYVRMAAASTAEEASRQLVAELAPGDRLELARAVALLVRLHRRGWLAAPPRLDLVAIAFRARAWRARRRLERAS